MASMEIQVRRREEPAEVQTLKFDGEEFTFTIPSDGQIALAMGSMGDDNNIAGAMSGLLLFMKGVLEPDGYNHLRGVLNDPEVEEPLDVLLDLFYGIVESTSGDPTSSSSDSSPSPAKTGARSTATSRRAPSTPSASRRAGSRTSSTSSSRKE